MAFVTLPISQTLSHPAAVLLIVIFLLVVSRAKLILLPATKFIYESEDWLKVATSVQSALTLNVFVELGLAGKVTVRLVQLTVPTVLLVPRLKVGLLFVTETLPLPSPAVEEIVITLLLFSTVVAPDHLICIELVTCEFSTWLM